VELFEEVAEALRGLVPADLGEFRHKTHRYGTKVWFGPEAAPKEHYEAQVIGAQHVTGATVLGLEVGFHSEHPKPADNEAVGAGLLAAEASWRPVLGEEAEAGPFLGRADNWRRISETWPDPDLEDLELGIELAVRLFDYITALEPNRSISGEAPPPGRGPGPGAGRPPR
jgi:hypothetical protein